MIKGSHHSRETKGKMSKAQSGGRNHMYGRNQTEEAKEINRIAHSGKNNYNFGKHLSDETKEKLRIINLKENLSSEKIEKMRLAKLGKCLSELTKKRMSISKMGKSPWNKGKKTGQIPWSKGKIGVFSERTLEKMRIARLGKTSWNKGEKFSIKSREKMSKSHIGLQIGENSPRWKGGITPLVQQLRHNFKYRQWRSDIFTRDDFTCQNCGDNKGGNLEAHHKKTFSSILQKYEITTIEEALECEKLWDINNGITLCEKCHKKLHKRLREKRF